MLDNENNEQEVYSFSDIAKSEGQQKPAAQEGQEESLSEGIKLEKKKPERTVFIVKHDNNSGQGEPAPASITKKFNWGAFLFNFLWGIKYRRYFLVAVPILLLLPFGFLIAIPMAVYAGMKGNQWAWEEVQYKNEDDFNKSQTDWVRAWCWVAAIALIIYTPFAINKAKKAPKIEPVKTEKISEDASLELKIPREVFDDTVISDNDSQLLTSERNLIYWVRFENEQNLAEKKEIEDIYNKLNTLSQNFKLYPDLIKQEIVKGKRVPATLDANCGDRMCVDKWLYKTCSTGFCIINPQKGTYYVVRSKAALVPQARKAASEWK